MASRDNFLGLTDAQVERKIRSARYGTPRYSDGGVAQQSARSFYRELRSYGATVQQAAQTVQGYIDATSGSGTG